MYIKCGGLHSSEHNVYIQQIFVDSKPTRLLAYLEMAPFGSGCCDELHGSPFGSEGLISPAALPQFGTTRKGYTSFRSLLGVGRGVVETTSLFHFPPLNHPSESLLFLRCSS